MVKELGNVKVNATFKLGELSPELKDFILTVGREMTNSRVSTALLNGYLTKRLYNDDTVLGIQIYKDYFKCVDLVYPAYNYETYYEGQKNPEIHYTFVEIGRADDHSISMSEWSERAIKPTIEWLRNNPNVKFEDLEKELDSFVNDYRIVRDYDQEEFDEAWEMGDMDAIEDIVGDRDLTEFI